MTCEELETQRIEFQAEYDAAQQLLAAAQLVLAELVNPTPEELAAANALVAAAMSLVSAASSNLMWASIFLASSCNLLFTADRDMPPGMHPLMYRLYQLYKAKK